MADDEKNEGARGRARRTSVREEAENSIAPQRRRAAEALGSSCA